MRIHQVISTKPGHITHRPVSCFCQSSRICDCHEPKSFTFPDVPMAPRKDLGENKHRNAASTTTLDPRQLYFREVLQKLQNCDTYSVLKDVCQSLARDVEAKYPLVTSFDYSRVIIDEVEVDSVSQQLLPSDCPLEDPIPVKIVGDGNCLPRTASYLAFGHQNAHEEFRARIVMELCNNDTTYLNASYLRQGFDVEDCSVQPLRTSFCMYSGFFQPVAEQGKVTDQNIDDTFRKEVVHITKSGTYMGIWQLMALSGVLGSEIFSIYPSAVNPNVRKHFNRLVIPPTIRGNETTHYVMWTSCKLNKHFTPNHFVPLLPTSLPARSLLGKYVVVRYDDEAYPGIVTDESDGEVEVKCLHRVGRNRFYWPVMDDLCYYTLDDILGEIPGPQKVTQRHLEVDPLLWENIIKKLV